MKIGWMIYGSLGKMSGGYLYDRLVVEGLREAGHEVEVISMPDVGWWRSLPHNWDANLMEETLELDLDLLVQDELNHPSLFLFNHWFKRRTRIPVVSLVHHLRSSEHHPAPLCPVYSAIERLYLSTVDAFVFNSSFTKDDVDRKSPLGNRPWTVAYPGKDRLQVRLSEAEVLDRCRQPGPLRLLFVGNLIPRKGLLFLLQALVLQPTNLWTLTVVGSHSADPAYFRKVQRFIRHHLPQARIEFLGLQPDSVVARCYRESHVLVLPSDIEGYGIVYAEALGFGLPCLAAAKGGAGELIQDGVNGVLIEYGQVEHLRAVLTRQLRDRAWVERLSLNALRRYDEAPAWRDTQERVSTFLESLVGLRARGGVGSA